MRTTVQERRPEGPMANGHSPRTSQPKFIEKFDHTYLRKTKLQPIQRTFYLEPNQYMQCNGPRQVPNPAPQVLDMHTFNRLQKV